MKIAWNEVQEQIKHDDQGKMDWTVPIENVRMNGQGIVGDNRFGVGITDQLGLGMNGLTPNEHALGQLASRVGIPARYAKKCYDQDPKLLAGHFNYWTEQLVEDSEKDKQWFLRGKGDELRAVLSDRYSQLDNSFVFEALGHSLHNGSMVDVKNFDLNSKYLNFRVVFPDLSANVGTSINRDDVMVGIHVTNSEVGSSSLRIDSCLFRLVCSNGMIARVGGDSLMQQRHVHLTRQEMENRVADAIGQAMKVGDGLIEKFARTREVTVSNPMKVLEDLAKKQKYSEQFTDTLKSSFNSEPGESAFHIVNAFTHASKSLPFDRRVEVETFAGKVMDNFLDIKNVQPKKRGGGFLDSSEDLLDI